MRIQESRILSADQKNQIIDLWNNAFPSTIGLGGMDAFEQYLSRLKDHHHLMLTNDNGSVLGWFFDFIRDQERWFIVMINPDLHGQGWGRRLMQMGMRKNEKLNGWVVNTADYETKDGEPYPPPVEFYKKLGFEILPDVKLELPQINTIKITWQKH